MVNSFRKQDSNSADKNLSKVDFEIRITYGKSNLSKNTTLVNLNKKVPAMSDRLTTGDLHSPNWSSNKVSIEI